jgi:hypothetical protein
MPGTTRPTSATGVRTNSSSSGAMVTTSTSEGLWRRLPSPPGLYSSTSIGPKRVGPVIGCPVGNWPQIVELYMHVAR